RTAGWLKTIGPQGMTLAAPAPQGVEDRVIPFPATGPAPDFSRTSTDVPLDVRPEQIRLLRQHPSLILLNLVNALLVVIVLWPIFPRELLLGGTRCLWSSFQSG